MSTNNGQFQWRATNARTRGRHDDIAIIDRQTVWAVNSSGYIIKTEDGGRTWDEKFHVATAAGSNIWLRSIGFATPQRGWLGTTSSAKPFFETRDAGESWQQVTGLPEGGPPFVCGISVVDEQTIWISGTNEPHLRTGVMKTIDGGETWTGIDMNEYADLLVDCYFTDKDRGWVVGGKADIPNPGRANVKPVVLFTEDGGQTWVDQVAAIQNQLPKGEWGWKIFPVTESTIYISLENFGDAAVLKTTDGGTTWIRKHVNDPQNNVNLEGIGFVDENHGWVGGWGDSSATIDGGDNWTDANEIGKFLNRFRFYGTPIEVGYASGDTIYKYSAETVPPAAEESTAPRLLANIEPEVCDRCATIDFTVPEDAQRVTIDVWDHFAIHVDCFLDERNPAPGRRSIEWPFTDAKGQKLPAGFYVYRVTVDDESDSRIVRLK